MIAGGLSWWRAVAFAAVGLAVAAYIVCATIHVVPLSAATFEIRKVSDPWLEPLFSQRWSFFAPSPPRTVTETEVRAEYGGGGRPGRTTPWLDMSHYLNAQSKSRPLAPSRIYRVAANIERGVVSPAPGRDISERRPFVSDPPSDEKLRAELARFRHRSEELDVALAAYVLRRQAHPAERLVGLELRVVVWSIPSFGQRNARPSDAGYLAWESGWRAMPEDRLGSRP